ncbi:MAG: hypothetical protein KatS3mg057_2491 [Herpetosiphonaceae bacterium]|nr:MAG: hypothetical protein KatS3mg057_2491 [Herpetosiphonaceae bacterium]
MKLMVFVVDNAHAEQTVDALVGAGFRVTRLASTGGWLRKGNTTLLVGLEDQEASHSIEVVRQAAPGALAVMLPLERFERL